LTGAVAGGVIDIEGLDANVGGDAAAGAEHWNIDDGEGLFGSRGGRFKDAGFANLGLEGSSAPDCGQRTCFRSDSSKRSAALAAFGMVAGLEAGEAGIDAAGKAGILVAFVGTAACRMTEDGAGDILAGACAVAVAVPGDVLPGAGGGTWAATGLIGACTAVGNAPGPEGRGLFLSFGDESDAFCVPWRFPPGRGSRIDSSINRADIGRVKISSSPRTSSSSPGALLADDAAFPAALPECRFPSRLWGFRWADIQVSDAPRRPRNGFSSTAVQPSRRLP
jgi:hypothetical protein